MSALAPAVLEAHEPPEVRGSGRDDVALLVASRGSGSIEHARFDELPLFLKAGDLLVVNTSATLAAALDARLEEEQVELRLSTPAGGRKWVVELRHADGSPFRRPPIGGWLHLAGGGHAELLAPFACSERLTVASLELDRPVEEYLQRHGRPIRYGYVPEAWPLDAYQTIFAREPGSAEMPSAGRPFTTELVTELVSRGVLVAPVTLHTGVSSPERGEPPYPERYSVPETTARLVNAVHGLGRSRDRSRHDGRARARDDGGRGWNGLWRRGLDEPRRHARSAGCTRSTACSAAGTTTTRRTSRCSRRPRAPTCSSARTAPRWRAATCWHEFGDVHLILP